MPEENELQDQSSIEEVDGEITEEGSASESLQPEAEEIEIDGRKYTRDEINEALAAREDYKSLLSEFTRRSQKLAELEKQLQTVSQSSKPEDEKLQEARRILKEQLEFVPREDLEKALEDFRKKFEEEFSKKLQEEKLQDVQTQQVISALSKKYSGEKGEPKFDYDKLVRRLYEKYGYDKDNSNWPPVIDLEYEYWDLNRDYFSKIPEIKSKVEPTERSGSAPFTLGKKKIVFEPTGKDEVSAEEAARELLRE